MSLSTVLVTVGTSDTLVYTAPAAVVVSLRSSALDDAPTKVAQYRGSSVVTFGDLSAVNGVTDLTWTLQSGDEVHAISRAGEAIVSYVVVG